MEFKWHMVVLLLVGYLIGYYFRGLGDATVAKVVSAG